MPTRLEFFVETSSTLDAPCAPRRVASVCLSVCFQSVSPFVCPRSFRVAAGGFRFRRGYRWRMKRVGGRLNEVPCFSREPFSSWLYAGCTLAVNCFSVKRRPVKMISRVRVELQMETWIIVGLEKRNLKKVCVGMSWYGLDISQWNPNAWIGSFLTTLRNEREKRELVNFDLLGKGLSFKTLASRFYNKYKKVLMSIFDCW